MPHETALIATVAAGLGLAFVFGFLAAKLRLPPLVGYLLAGVAVGPFSPGYVADTNLAGQLAEIGVILLMFGVGLHFSFPDLLAVRKIALPGAAVQIAVATALGAGLARLWGWPWAASLVFGLSLSVASTVVLLRALEERGLLESADGRIAVGWLIVEDLAMVLALVLLPAIAAPLAGGAAAASGGSVVGTVALTLGKVAVFVAFMHVIGRRAVPWLLARVARIGSRELFTLGILAVALGIAVGAAALFGVSFALGAFFAGVVISESDLSHRVASDALPLRDAFAVLFFVSVGMLLDPAVLVQRPLQVLLVLLIIVAGKSAAAFGIVVAFRYPLRTALTISASLAQIGEFSFILVALGLSLNLLTLEARNLILAGAILSITLNPFVFNTIEPIRRWLLSRPRRGGSPPSLQKTPEPKDSALTGHAVIVGYGRVGGAIGEALARAGIPQVVVEQDRLTVEAARRRGILAVYGDAARPGILEHVSLGGARLLVVATPNPFEARQVIELARALNPEIDIVVRTHSAAEQEYLAGLRVGRAFMGERELALAMARYALRALGSTESDAERIVEAMSQTPGEPPQVALP